MKRAKKIVILFLVATVILSFFAITLMMTFYMAIISEEEKNKTGIDGFPILKITFDGEVVGNEILLTAEIEDGFTIEGIRGIVSDNGQFEAENEIDDEATGRKLELPGSPANLSFPGSMQPRMVQSNYNFSLDNSYGGFKLANGQISGKTMSEDSDGCARVGSDYVISLGSAYFNSGADVGRQRYLITFADGQSITAILGDSKADAHTNKGTSPTGPKHSYHTGGFSDGLYYGGDNSVIEVHAWNKSVSSATTALRNRYPTKIVSLQKISSGKAKLSGKIENGKITISGTIDDIPLSASGSVLGNQIHAEGLYGTITAPGGTASGTLIVSEALNYVNKGMPYTWGGSNPSTSFDCSGFVCYVFNRVGYTLPRTTANEYYNMCIPITKSEAEPGDLVFFEQTYSSNERFTHIGIYLGNDQMAHFGNPGSTASIYVIGKKPYFGRLNVRRE